MGCCEASKRYRTKDAQRVVNELKEKAPQIMAMAAVFGQSAVEKQEPISKDSKDNADIYSEGEVADTMERSTSSSEERQKSSRSFISFKKLGL